MNDTLQAHNEIVCILDESQNPTWLLYLSALGPLVLTAISVFIACRQHRQNQALQKQIADRDYKNILRQNLLAIYNDFFNGLRVVDQAFGNVAEVFSVPKVLSKWALELQTAYEQMTASYNHARLMLDDDKLVEVLKHTYDCFTELYDEFNSYCGSGEVYSVIGNSFNAISAKYGVEDEIALFLNPAAKEEYLKLCDTDNAKKIHGLMQAYIEAMADDNFDVYFNHLIDF